MNYEIFSEKIGEEGKKQNSEAKAGHSQNLLYEKTGNQYPENNDPKKVNIKVEGYRFVIFLIHSLCAFFSCAIVFGLSPLVNTLDKVFKINDWTIFFLTNFYLYTGTILNFPVLFFIQKLRVKNSMTAGLLLLFLGSVLKVFIAFNTNFLIVGQGLCAIGYEWFHPVIGAIACNWFPPNHRYLVFGLSMISYTLGGAFSSLLAAIFVSDPTVYKEKDSYEVEHLLIFFAVSCGVLLLLHLVFFKERSETLPGSIGGIEKLDFLESIKTLAKNKDYIKLFFGTTCMLSFQNTRNNSYNYLIQPFGFSQSEAGYLSSLEGWASMLGIITVSFLSQRVLDSRLILKLIPAFILFFFIVRLICLFQGGFWPAAISGFFLGLGISSFIPITDNLSITTTYPVPENVSIGMYFTGGLLGGWATGAATTAIRVSFGSYTYLWVCYSFFIFLLVLAGILFYLIDGTNTREEQDN